MLPLIPALLVLAAGPLAPAERVAAFGVGGAVERESGSTSPGAAAFVEYEAWPDRLEVEVGAQVLAKGAGREYSVDLVVKWPHPLTEHLEIMMGAGPTLTGGGRGRARFAVEAAVDVMWWPLSPVGFWIEPSVELLIQARAASRATGVSAATRLRDHRQIRQHPGTRGAGSPVC